MLDSKPLLFPSDFPKITRDHLQTLQINLGFKCNQTCTHCHVNAGPNRVEMMSDEVIEDVIHYCENHPVSVIDLTGGAPEMHPAFRSLVRRIRALGIKVIDRCNLTILNESDQFGLADFLAENGVEIVASLPCYLEENVDGQRGNGVFDSSITALKKLNALGYGKGNDDRVLNLVYNPVGAYLPPDQLQLQVDYKEQLSERFGVVFDQLFTITNMPIARFGSVLQSKGEFDQYLHLLKGAYQACHLKTVMCRNLVSVDWQGYVYDCDFNQMLDMKMMKNDHALTLADLNAMNLMGQNIMTGEHCYGCTAGNGSSCGGALF